MFLVLLTVLLCAGWVNNLCGGQKNGAKGFAFFSVNVDLTEEGQGQRVGTTACTHAHTHTHTHIHICI